LDFSSFDTFSFPAAISASLDHDKQASLSTFFIGEPVSFGIIKASYRYFPAPNPTQCLVLLTVPSALLSLALAPSKPSAY
jgi:hypothetical protein